MRDAVLEQPRYLDRRRSRLTSDGVEVREGGPWRSQSYTIPYEAIGSSVFEVGTASRGWLVAAGVSFGFALLLALARFHQPGGPASAAAWAVCGAVMALRFWLSRRHTLGLVGAQRPLVFVAGRSDAERLGRFLHELGRRRIARFRELLECRRDPKAFLHQLEGLQLHGFLTAAELHEIQRGFGVPGNRELAKPGRPPVAGGRAGVGSDRSAVGLYL